MKTSPTGLRALGALGVALLLPACGIGGGGTLTPTVAPGTPPDVRVRAGNRSVKVTWTSSATGAQYGVFRALTATGPFFQVPGSGQFQEGTSFVDADVVNGTTYYYEITAVNSFGSSAASPVLSGTPGFFATQITSAAAGTSLSALLQDGTVWGWGGIAGSFFSAVPFQIPGLPEITSISSGMALSSDGRVWCWGDNSKGQRGNGTTDALPLLVPTVVSSLSGIQAVSSGGASCLALSQDGTVWAWGANESGELGQPLAPYNAVPTQIAGLSDIIAISGGLQYNLALARDGLVWAWGSNGSGQLGNGTVSVSIPTPAAITSLTSVTAIAAGGYHSVALKSDGTVWCWGINNNAQIGTGSTSPSVPSPFQVPGLTSVAAIGAGFEHTVVAKKNGSVLAWGQSSQDQVGVVTGTTVPVATPTLVSTLSGIVSVSGSMADSMALGSDGSVWVWGDNNNGGELGNGTSYLEPLPQQVPNFAGVVGASAGSGWMMAVRSDGSAWVWAGQVHGIYGKGTSTPSPTPAVPMKIAALSGVSALSAGGNHELAILTNGTVWAWGANDSGQIGNNASGADVLSPVQVLTQAASISAGASHSLAVRSDNTLWSWGNNQNGQLGTGTMGTNILLPTPIAALSGVQAASAGSFHSLAVLSDGTVWAWGDNSAGELGQPSGSLASSLPPIAVAGAPKSIAVAAGLNYSLALAADGTVWSWGSNNYGLLGRGGATETPAPVEGLSNIVSVSAGVSFAMALRSDGTVWSWGNNGLGQLGNLVMTSSPTPVQALGLTNISAISAGQLNAMAVGRDGILWACGAAIDGELGVAPVGQTAVPVQITR
jgi:alpha-tubulin suppressor-like RCC1 family protein